MKKIVSLFALAALALGLTSCFEYKGTVSVNKDGTATLEEVSLVSAQFKAMLGGAGGGGDEAGNPMAGLKSMLPDKAKAEERAKSLGEGVTVKSHEEVTMPDGKSGVKVVYAIQDINKFSYLPEGSKDKGKSMTFALAGNNLSINNPEDKSEKPAKPEQPKEAKLAQLAMIKPMMAGMHLTIEVKAVGGIASTDAAHVAGDTITIMELDFDKLAKNDETLVEVLDSMESKMTSAQAAEKFKGIDGVKVEGKETIKVVLK